MTMLSKILAAALISATAPWVVSPAAAAPIASPLALQDALAPSVETVQYRRNWRRGGAGVGLAAGAIIGGAIIGAGRSYGYEGYDRRNGYDSGYAYAPGYGQRYVPDDEQGYVAVAPDGGGSDAAYCRQRYRSYDPASGTYLGFDGLRHPCT
jgi:BA14K-like protein